MKRLHIIQMAQSLDENQARAIEEILGGLEGVLRANVDVDAETLEVEYDDAVITKFQIASVLKTHGYAARV